MATHEQTHLGPIFDEMRDDGLIDFGEDENGETNSYGLAADFCRRIRGIGLDINADVLCEACYPTEYLRKVARMEALVAELGGLVADIQKLEPARI